MPRSTQNTKAATSTTLTAGTGITIASDVVAIDDTIVAKDADLVIYKTAYELPKLIKVAAQGAFNGEVKFAAEISATGFGFAPPAFVYEKFSGSTYRVTLQGMAKRVVAGQGQTFFTAQPLFTMPDGSGVLPNLRPQAGTLVFRCAAQNSGEVGANKLNRTTRIDIGTNGTVVVNAGGGGDLADMVNLACVSYWVNDYT